MSMVLVDIFLVLTYTFPDGNQPHFRALYMLLLRMSLSLWAWGWNVAEVTFNISNGPRIGNRGPFGFLATKHPGPW